MPAFEAVGFTPPAPVVTALVHGPSGLTQNGLRLLIDSGAAVSVLPLSAAYAVGAQIEPSDVPVQFFSGEQASYLQASLSIEFLRYRFRCVFLLTDADYGIVGRNILNLLLLTLDGPRLFWTA